MANYAYLRVSTDQQDVDNQRHGILEYANQRNINGLQFVEDSVSGKVKWRDRKSGDLLLKTMQPCNQATPFCSLKSHEWLVAPCRFWKCWSIAPSRN